MDATAIFVCFRFVVGDKAYCWHQPAHSVKFAYNVTTEESRFTLTEEEKPITLSPEQLDDALLLLCWLIAKAKPDTTVPTRSEIARTRMAYWDDWEY